MQQSKIVSGFSDLKNLIIRTYKIEQDREFVKLFFSEKDNELLIHDYNDHSRVLTLVRQIDAKEIRIGLTANAYRLVKESLNHKSPSEFLINEFQLSGFFRS